MDKTRTSALAPAYDITFSLNSTNIWLKEHQLLVNGKSRNLNSEDLLTSGINMGLRKNVCQDIINKIISTVADWPSYAESAGIGKRSIITIQEQLDKNLAAFT